MKNKTIFFIFILILFLRNTQSSANISFHKKDLERHHHFFINSLVRLLIEYDVLKPCYVYKTYYKSNMIENKYSELPKQTIVLLIDICEIKLKTMGIEKDHEQFVRLKNSFNSVRIDPLSKSFVLNITLLQLFTLSDSKNILKHQSSINKAIAYYFIWEFYKQIRFKDEEEYNSMMGFFKTSKFFTNKVIEKESWAFEIFSDGTSAPAILNSDVLRHKTGFVFYLNACNMCSYTFRKFLLHSIIKYKLGKQNKTIDSSVNQKQYIYECIMDVPLCSLIAYDIEMSLMVIKDSTREIINRIAILKTESRKIYIFFEGYSITSCIIMFWIASALNFDQAQLENIDSVIERLYLCYVKKIVQNLSHEIAVYYSIKNMPQRKVKKIHIYTY